ncbi:MAG: hypothetical protein ACKO24_16435, partial [Leptolyngbyaceae cyanobacterium]
TSDPFRVKEVRYHCANRPDVNILTYSMFLVLHRFVENRFTGVSAIEGGGNQQVAKPVVMVTKTIEIRFARLLYSAKLNDIETN